MRTDWRRLLIGLVLGCTACVAGRAAAAAELSLDALHGPWSELLTEHVVWIRDGHASTVDYAGFARDRGRLQAYLDGLSTVDARTFSTRPRAERLAFLINAYNAFTVALVLEGWPDIQSIKDLGSLFRSPWKRAFFTLLGETRHLDAVEHDLIRGNPELMDARIHFAVNCASIGCPALRPEAYTGERLDAQLEDQTRRFLGDRERNRIEGDRLWLSPLFRWYRDDFGDDDPPWPFLMRHAGYLRDAGGTHPAIDPDALDIDFTEYDWTLNAPPR